MAIVQVPFEGRRELTMAQYEALETINPNKDYIITDLPKNGMTSVQMGYALTCRRLFPAGFITLCLNNGGNYIEGSIYKVILYTNEENETSKQWEYIGTIKGETADDESELFLIATRILKPVSLIIENNVLKGLNGSPFSIEIPQSVIGIGTNALFYAQDLSEIKFLSNIPPVFGVSWAPEPIQRIIVPTDTRDSYIEAIPEYANIIEEEQANVLPVTITPAAGSTSGVVTVNGTLGLVIGTTYTVTGFVDSTPFSVSEVAQDGTDMGTSATGIVYLLALPPVGDNNEEAQLGIGILDNCNIINNDSVYESGKVTFDVHREGSYQASTTNFTISSIVEEII